MQKWRKGIAILMTIAMMGTMGPVSIYGQTWAAEQTADQDHEAQTADQQEQEMTILFDPNGGLGRMSAQLIRIGETGKLQKNAFTREGHVFVGWALKENAQTADFADEEKIDTNDIRIQKTKVTFYAVWKKSSYKITYKLNGGKNNSKNPSVYRIEMGEVSLKAPTRKGYDFKGWYQTKDYKKKITKISADITNDLTLYAKWSAKSYAIRYKLGGGRNNAKNPSSYKITSKTVTLKAPTKSNHYFAGWYSDKNYKKKVTKIAKGSTGTKTLYAKWIKEYKATATSAKITGCEAKTTNKIEVNAKVAKRIKSSDNYYYLVTVDPVDQSMRQAAKKVKAGKVSYTLDLSKDRSYVQSRYAIAIKQNKKFVRISKVSGTIQTPQKSAMYKAAYKKGSTKKGIQCTDVAAAKKAGAKNLFLNLNVSTILSNAASEPVTYRYHGKNYRFGGIGGYRATVAAANQKKMNVTLQLNLDSAVFSYDASLIAPQAREQGHLYYTWNTTEKAAREKMEAMFCYLAEIFGSDTCYVSNWILGNEVNSASIWNYRGSMSDDQFYAAYARSFRVMYNAVRSVRANSKVCICVDNIWHRAANENHGFNTRDFLDHFATAIEKEQKGIVWNIAYHPYTVRIDYPDFWNAASYYQRPDLVNQSVDTQFVTMQNISVLTEYVRQRFGSNHRILITEVGFDTSKGNDRQAAAIAYAYNIAACNSMIDTFIIRSIVDEAGDGSFHFGIQGREAWNVYKQMDTSSAEKYTNRYLGLIGVGSWSQIVPNYNRARLTKNQ